MIVPQLSSSVPVGALAALMLALAIKHVAADFLFQTDGMARGKDRVRGWAAPLLTHCAIHGVLTTLLVLAIAPKLWFLGPIDFLLHLTIDRAKGASTVAFAITPDNRWFWSLIGTDQALHHLTNFALAVVIAANL
jgi:hypothetical protein